MWIPQDGLVSHGQSAKGIKPSGFRKGREGHQSVYDMEESFFDNMVYRHVCRN